MLTTPTIRQFDAGAPHIYAFRVLGEVRAEDFRAMAQTMNDAFDRRDALDMLLVFEAHGGSETGAGLDGEVVRSQVRSLWNVRNYVVAGAPAGAERLIEAMGAVLPVQARTFDTKAAALAALRAEPAPT